MQKSPAAIQQNGDGAFVLPLPLLSCYSQGNAKREKGLDTSMGLRTVAGAQIAPVRLKRDATVRLSDET